MQRKSVTMVLMAEKKSEIIGVRITPALKKKLEKRAQMGYRTLSQEVEMILQKELKKS